MSHLDAHFLSLLKLGIGTVKATDTECEPLLKLAMSKWRELMNLATNQGVAAVANDGLQVLFDERQKDMIAVMDSPIEWKMWVIENAGVLTQYEQRNVQQRKIISEVAGLLAKNGIRMMIFKGQANASFYPNSLHRAPGDVDCYLFGYAAAGDKLLAVNGASIDNRWYRHSKISYKGETIENHRVMGHTRGSKKKQEMDSEFRFMVQGEGLNVIEGCGKAQMPTAQFNACFLTYHGLHHFLTEGLRMKQVLDWAVFLKEKQEEVDWPTFNAFCKKYQLDRFAAVMNYIAVHYLGVAVQEDSVFQDRKYAEKIMQSTLYDDYYLFNSGKCDWMVRWLLVKNMLGRDKWKYQDVAQENVWKHLWDNVKGFLMKEEE